MRHFRYISVKEKAFKISKPLNDMGDTGSLRVCNQSSRKLFVY